MCLNPSIGVTYRGAERVEVLVWVFLSARQFANALEAPLKYLTSPRLERK
jgi:hypothetical protein